MIVSVALPSFCVGDSGIFHHEKHENREKHEWERVEMLRPWASGQAGFKALRAKEDLSGVKVTCRDYVCRSAEFRCPRQWNLESRTTRTKSKNTNGSALKRLRPWANGQAGFKALRAREDLGRIKINFYSSRRILPAGQNRRAGLGKNVRDRQLQPVLKLD